MEENRNECIFCNIPKERIISENEHAIAIRDAFPVTGLHTLIITKRHLEDYFSLTTEELLACHSLLHSNRDEILKNDESVEGFNIGMNSGMVAGQTIFHSHIHLIPRRQGDVAKPKGGVRNIIYGKGYY